MANILRKIASAKVGKVSQSKRDYEAWKTKTALNKERDKLLHEFLLAREELKLQFDYEKREIISNYERRNTYLRRLLEECDENINMLKLNLDAEREENFILKTKLMKLESKNKYGNVGESPGYLNKSYDEESMLSSKLDVNNSRNHSCNHTLTKKERSSIDGLKYSDKFGSQNSVAKSSCFTSVSSIDSVISECNDSDIHYNCRKEFARLLEELRRQEDKYESQLADEKQRMREKIDDEKLQMEKIVFKQLNYKLEREIKKRELLVTENTHLRQTISKTIIDAITDCCNKNQNIEHLKDPWKETNSDSGADVEYNKSDDDESDLSDSGKSSCGVSDYNLNSVSDYNLNSLDYDSKCAVELVNKMCDKSKLTVTKDFQNQYLKEHRKLKNTIESLNKEIVSLVNENRALKDQTSEAGTCMTELSGFHDELTNKLLLLEDMLTDDDADDFL